MQDKEVTLKLNSRPLKLVYLVRSSDDLFNAISLYTHLWGGVANYMLPFLGQPHTFLNKIVDIS